MMYSRDVLVGGVVRLRWLGYLCFIICFRWWGCLRLAGFRFLV